MKTNKTKRKYEKPTVRVVELHNRTMLLTGSGGYPNGINPMDDPEDI